LPQHGNPDLSWFSSAEVDQLPLRFSFNGQNELRSTPPVDRSGDTTIGVRARLQAPGRQAAGRMARERDATVT